MVRGTEHKIYHLPFAISHLSFRKDLGSDSLMGCVEYHGCKWKMVNGKWQMENLHFGVSARYKDDDKD